MSKGSKTHSPGPHTREDELLPSCAPGYTADISPGKAVGLGCSIPAGDSGAPACMVNVPVHPVPLCARPTRVPLDPPPAPHPAAARRSPAIGTVGPARGSPPPAPVTRTTRPSNLSGRAMSLAGTKHTLAVHPGTLGVIRTAGKERRGGTPASHPPVSGSRRLFPSGPA